MSPIFSYNAYQKIISLVTRSDRRDEKDPE